MVDAMKVTANYIAVVISLFVILILAIACVKRPPEQAARTGIPFGLQVVLPRDVKNSEREPAVLKESSVIVSIPVEKQFFVGPEPYPKEDLGHQISQRIKGQAEADRIVYLAAGDSVDYGDIVEIIDIARKESVVRIGLLVSHQSGSGDGPSLFKVQIPPEPDPDEELINFKPNPLTLVVSINRDLKLELNREPMGTAPDTANLTQMLTRVFQNRKEQRAYKPGMETRTDLPEDERVEKTIIVKASRSTPYGHVVRIIDAIKGAGANPIILQIDDLAE